MDTGSIGLETYGNVWPDLAALDVTGEVGEAGSAGSTQGGRQVPDAISPDELARMREQPEIDGKAAMKNAKVDNLRSLVVRRNSVGKSIGNIFRFFARNFAKFCHVVRNGFASAPDKSSRANFQETLELRHAAAYQAESRVGTLQRGQGTGTAYSCETEILGTAMGLRKNITVRPFTEAQVETIRQGRFKLADIKQDPNFADCWFLGALASFLTAKGPGAIQELITLPPPGEMNEADPSNPPKALVKLGGETYAVPLAELHDGMGSGVSTSAPWVKLMETAMQMYLVKMQENRIIVGGHAEKVDMAFGDTNVALYALLGGGISYPQHENTKTHQMVADPPEVDSSGRVGMLSYNPNQAGGDIKSIIGSVQEALNNNRAVVLASSDSLVSALGAGISPNHCVSVQDVVFKKDGTAYFQVFDPYGRSVSISSDILKDVDTHIYLERAQ